MKKITWLAKQANVKHSLSDVFNLFKGTRLIKKNITANQCKRLFYYQGNSKDVYREHFLEHKPTDAMTKKQMSQAFSSLVNSRAAYDIRHKPWRNIQDNSAPDYKVKTFGETSLSKKVMVGIDPASDAVVIQEQPMLIELPVVAKPKKLKKTKKTVALPTPYDDAAFRKTLAANETFINGTDNVVVVTKEVKETHSMVHFTMVVDGEQKKKRKYLKDFHELLKVNGYL